MRFLRGVVAKDGRAVAFGEADATTVAARSYLDGFSRRSTASTALQLARASSRRRDDLALVSVLLDGFDPPKQIINLATSASISRNRISAWNSITPPYLLVLCTVFLALILVNGWFKLHVKLKRGSSASARAAPLRHEVYERALRFPLHHFDRGRPRADRTHDHRRAGAGRRLCRRSLCGADLAGRHPARRS